LRVGLLLRGIVDKLRMSGFSTLSVWLPLAKHGLTITHQNNVEEMESCVQALMSAGPK